MSAARLKVIGGKCPLEPNRSACFPTNGLKKWMIGLLTAILLAWSAWVGTSVMANATRITAVEAVIPLIHQQLQQINQALNVMRTP